MTWRELGETLYDQARDALRTAEAWQADNPTVADYRVTDAIAGLRQATEALRQLAVNGHSAAWHAAMESFRCSLAADGVGR